MSYSQKVALKEQEKREEEERIRSKKPLYANRTQLSKMISNEFLFGDDLPVDVKIMKQLELRDKRNGPKVKKKEDHKMKEEPQHATLFGNKNA